MKKIFLMAAFLLAVSGASAQTFKKQIVEEGGTGPYKAEIVGDSTLERFTIYRPQQLKQTVAKAGKMPVILYANGACANNNVEIRYFLNELASQGYVAAAIGPYDEADFYAHWTEVLQMMHPKNKKTIMANGVEVQGYTEEQIQEFLKNRRQAEEAAKKKSKKGQAVEAPSPKTYPKMLLEVLDWLTEQNVNPKSEYYHCLDLSNVAVMGQSCGGAQALVVSYDPRIKTSVILNSGFGDMDMQGGNKQTLEELHTPMLYLNGGEGDIAYPNSEKDYQRIQVPIVLISSQDEHEGTYYEKHGGAYAVVVRKWLDWQLKNQIGQSALFLDDEYFQKSYADWTLKRKNFK